jgi:hypothetical protein
MQDEDIKKVFQEKKVPAFDKHQGLTKLQRSRKKSNFLLPAFASAMVLILTFTSYQMVQKNESVSDQEIAEFLFSDNYFSENGDDYL